MANVLVQDSSLTAIADAIREKNGSSDTYKPAEMAAAISAIETGGNDLTLRVDKIMTTSSAAVPKINRAVMNLLGDNGTLTLDAEYLIDGYYDEMFAFLFAGDNGSPDFVIDFSKIQLSNRLLSLLQNCTNSGEATSMFNLCKATECPAWVEYLAPTRTGHMFDSCIFTTIPAFKTDSMGDNTDKNSTGNSCQGMFNNAKKLTAIPTSVLKDMKHQNGTYNTVSSSFYYYGFYNCNALTAINDLGVETQYTGTANMFYQTFNNCYFLSSLTFETNNGTPISVDWKNQSISLNKQLRAYNSTSAAETINSLPDVTSGSSNTVSFQKAYVGTLAEEVVAVAVAKGWTVSIS